jgi:hypothetical protein
LTNDKTSKTEVIAAAVERVSDSKGLAAIGHGIGWGVAALAVACIYVALVLSPAAQKWDGHIHAQSKCFELKEIAGKVFKVNSCTGEVEEVAALPSAENPKSQVPQPAGSQGAASKPK